MKSLESVRVSKMSKISKVETTLESAGAGNQSARTNYTKDKKRYDQALKVLDAVVVQEPETVDGQLRVIDGIMKSLDACDTDLPLVSFS